MDDLLKYVLPLVAGVLGYAWFQKSKRDSAEALLQNNDTIKKANELEGKVEGNNNLLQNEEEKRKALQESIEKEKAETINAEELKKFFDKFTK